MMDITQSSYTQEIKDIAGELVNEAMTEHDNDQDIASDQIHDYMLHETIDGHGWVIYTYKASLVADYSDNYEAYQDVYDNESIGDIVSKGGLDAMIPVIAYFAMYQDVSETLEDAFSDYCEALDSNLN